MEQQIEKNIPLLSLFCIKTNTLIMFAHGDARNI